MTDPIQIPYTADETGALSLPPLQYVPAPPTASFEVAQNGLSFTFTDTSKRGGLPLAKVHFALSDGTANCDPGGAVQHTYPNESQRMVTQTVTDTAGNKGTAEKPVYPKAPAATPPPVSPPPSPPPPVSPPPPPPPTSPPPPATTLPAFALQIMDGNPDLPNAVVTGTAGGHPVNITVKPGQRVPLVNNADGTSNFQLGSVIYWPHGCIESENAYVGDGNPTPADLAVNLHIVCGDKTWDSDDITIEYRCLARPFWVVLPTPRPLDLSKFANYGKDSATASYAGAYANADNSPMGPGLVNTQIGNEGEHDWLGLLNAWDAAYVANQTPENEAVVLGMSEAPNVFPFHAVDTATNRMLDITAYPQASMLWACMGQAENPFKKYASAIPVKRTLDQCTGHAPSFHVLGAALYQTARDKARLSEWTAYLCAWQANCSYRLTNGPTKIAHEEGARGVAWTTRQLAQAAQFSDQPEFFTGWLKMRLDEINQRLADMPFPMLDAWLVYPTNNSSTGYAFAPWQVIHMLGQSLGYCRQLGYTAAQPVFNRLAKIAMDAVERQHESLTIYELTFCQGGDRANGKRAESWAECLQFHAELHPSFAAALACAEGSQALQDALGNQAPNNKPGDYIGYPMSPTGYAAIAQPMYAYIPDYYTDDPARAWACWQKFTDARWYRIAWNDPKYDIVPRRAA